MELQNISFDWNSVAAEAVLFLFAVLTIVLSAFSRGENKAAPVFAMCGIMAALLVEIFCSTVGSGETYFGGMLSGASSFGVFVLVCALLTGLMGFGYFAKGGKRGGEFMAVLMVCTAAMMLFVRANNLIYITPPLTMLFSALVLGERITPFAVAGGALILSGVYISQRVKK